MHFLSLGLSLSVVDVAFHEAVKNRVWIILPFEEDVDKGNGVGSEFDILHQVDLGGHSGERLLECGGRKPIEIRVGGELVICCSESLDEFLLECQICGRGNLVLSRRGLFRRSCTPLRSILGHVGRMSAISDSALAR